MIEEIRLSQKNKYKYVARFKGQTKWYQVYIYSCDDRVVIRIRNKMFTEMANRDDYLYVLEYIRNDILNNELLIAIESTFKRVKEEHENN